MLTKLASLYQGSVARNMVTLFLIFGIVPLAFLASIYLIFDFLEAKRNIENIQKAIAQRVAADISAYLARTTGQIEVFARMLNPGDRPGRHLIRLAQDFLSQGPEFDFITVTDHTGREICKVSRYYTYRPHELGRIADAESFRLALSGKTHFGKIEISDFSKFPFLPIFLPIIDFQDQIVGVLEVGVNITKMWGLISTYHIGPNRSAYTVDAQGTLIAFQDISSVLEKRNMSDILGVRELLRGNIGAFEYKGVNQSRVIGANAIIPVTGWGVIIEEPVWQALRHLYMLFGIFFVLLLVTAGSALLLGLRFSFKTIINPLRRLQEGAEQIAQGDFHSRLNLLRPDELGQVAGAFNRMVEELEKTTVSRNRLEKSLSLLHATLESTADGILVVDRDGQISSYNKKFVQIWNIPASILASKKYEEALASVLNQVKTPEDFLARIKELYGEPEAEGFDVIEFKDGRILERFSLPQRLGKDVVGRVWSFRDVTQQRHAEQALKDSERKYRKLMDTASDAIFTADFETGIIIDANLKASELLGIPTTEIIGMHQSQLHPPEKVEIYKEIFRQHAQQGGLIGEEIFVVNREGHLIPVEISASITQVENRHLVFGIFRDITQRKQAEEELQKLASIVRYSCEFVNLATLEGHMVFINQTGSRMLGIEPEEVEKHHILEFIPEDLQDKVRQEILPTLLGGGTWEGELIYLNLKTGQRTDVHAVTFSIIDPHHGKPFYLANVSLDITSRKLAEQEKAKLEAQLLQSQKMEAIGTLAGGIAHDFNNILVAILGYTDLALEFVAVDPQGRQYLEHIRAASYRAKELVEHILTFSRKKSGEKILLELRTIAKEALQLLRASLPATIEIRQNLGAQGRVVADPTQMHQVLMNLCTNASQAMPHGGILTVDLEDVELSANFHRDLPPGPYAKLEVADTGEGIDPAIQARIFEPYFTTKETGRGTGMGLAVVLGIVRSHGGVIILHSEPNQGSTFSIYLPRSQEEFKTPEIISTTAALSGSGRILLVDDEEYVAEFFSTAMKSIGYEVVTTNSSLEALEIFRSDPEKFDLVITDLTMPQLTGIDLAQNLLEIRADLPIILATGYSEKFSRDDLSKLGIRDIILKPIGIRDLTTKIKTVLEEKGRLVPVGSTSP